MRGDRGIIRLFYFFIKLLETFQGKVFSTHVRNAIALAEAPTQGQDIFHYAPKSAGAEDYEGVCNELLTEIK